MTATPGRKGSFTAFARNSGENLFPINHHPHLPDSTSRVVVRHQYGTPVVAYGAIAEAQTPNVSDEHTALAYVPLELLADVQLPDVYREAIAAATAGT